MTKLKKIQISKSRITMRRKLTFCFL